MSRTIRTSNGVAEAKTQNMISTVEPVLRKYSAQSEVNRRMAKEAIDAIIDAGILRALVPAAYGGYEMSLLTAVSMYEELSRIDSAARWIASNSGGIFTFGMMFSEQANRELYADPRALFAGGWFPPGHADAVPGGYRVTGQWAFGSGCDYANWLTGQVLVWGNAAPKVGSDGKPVALIISFRPSDRLRRAGRCRVASPFYWTRR